MIVSTTSASVPSRPIGVRSATIRLIASGSGACDDHLEEQPGLARTRRDHVDTDPVGRVLDRGLLRQVHQRALRRAVRRVARRADRAEDRAEQDHRATAARDHRRRSRASCRGTDPSGSRRARAATPRRSCRRTDARVSTAALHTSTSRRPCCSTIASNIAATSPSWVTSTTLGSASPPASAIASATRSARPRRCRRRRRCAPSAASRRAVAAPSPEPPPVTTATLPTGPHGLRQARHRNAASPPSAGITAPVVYAERSDARNSAMLGDVVGGAEPVQRDRLLEAGARTRSASSPRPCGSGACRSIRVRSRWPAPAGPYSVAIWRIERDEPGLRGPVGGVALGPDEAEHGRGADDAARCRSRPGRGARPGTPRRPRRGSWRS